MKGNQLASICLVAILLPASLLVAQDALPGGADAAQEAKLAERDLLWGESRELSEKGQTEEAIRLAEKALAIERELLGSLHDEVVGSLAWLSQLEESRGNIASAVGRLEEALAIRIELYGAGHWRVTDARQAIEQLNQRKDFTEDEKRQLARAAELNERVYGLFSAGEYRDAIPVAKSALEIRIRILGEEHPHTALSLFNLAAQYAALGDYQSAEPAYRRAHGIYRRTLGEEHPSFAMSLNGLAALYGNMGDYAGAVPLFQRAIEIRRNVLGEGHPDYATSLNDLAGIYLNTGEFSKAEPLFRQALEIWKEALGERHPYCATALDNLANICHAMGEYTNAEPLYLKALETMQGALGERHPESSRILGNLAQLYGSMGRYTEAVRLFRRVLKIEAEVLGEEHPAHAASLGNFAALLGEMGQYADAEALTLQALEIVREAVGEDHPAYATSLNNLAGIYSLMGLDSKAGPLYLQASNILREALGEGHPDYAASLGNIASHHATMGSYSRAEQVFLRAMELRGKALGEDHPDNASTVNGLALVYKAMGEFAKAEPLLRKALALVGSALGEDHPTYAASLSNLALLYLDMGRYAKAGPLFQRALETMLNVVGDEHPDYASSLGNLAEFYRAIGEVAKVEQLIVRAMGIQRAAVGENHPEYATSLNNLAAHYESIGELTKAEPLHLQALEITRAAVGEEHPDFAASLSNLAGLYEAMGEHSKPELLRLQVLEILRKAVGEEHPDYASGLSNLALHYESRGELSKSEPLYRQALGIARDTLGEEHPDYATGLGNIARLYQSKGEYSRAVPLRRQALDIRRRALNSTFSVQSERQQLQMTGMFRESLDSYLSLTSAANLDSPDAYAPALAWKGAIFARQAHSRIRWEDAEAERIFRELELASRRLATIVLSSAPPEQHDARRRKTDELTEEREVLERELSRRSEAYRERRAAESLTPRDLQAALTSGALLVDILGYERDLPPEKGAPSGSRTELHLVAFLVAAEGDIGRVELGPAAPIEEAVAAWRKSIARGRNERGGHRLRELLWKPLSKHLDGVETLLVSPDGVLNRLPLGALPGKKPGTYLIEEISVAVVPVPQMLPALLRRARDEDEQESLLLVGDVDYGGSPGADGGAQETRSAAGSVTGALPEFRRLAATPAEVAAIHDSFETHFEGRRVKLLRGAGATEAAFRDGAPSFRWLHLATHGFFAPPSLRSALADAGGGRRDGTKVAGYHPGLLSGLALSGANTPPEPDADDGILTALEVASLDLSGVEVAVLSACETGLGEVAGGEGVMGLQRAFQVAGARTTVTSLWSVPDRATQLLMKRFYANLWEKKMPKLEALREAQLWLMREGARPESDVARGLGIERTALESRNGRLPPYYWAGWVLSGDWR